MTGATGFIGTHLLTRLALDGYPTAVVLRPSSKLRARGRVAEEVVVVRHSGNTDRLISEMINFAPDVVLHLAARSRAVHQPEDVRPLLEANIVFGSEIIEAATLAGCRGVVATGTFWEHRGGGAAYEPNSLYAASKRAFANILEFYCQNYQLSAINLILTDVYGPNDSRHRLLDQLLDAQDGGGRLDMTPGEQDIDLIHVDDVVDAYLHAARLTMERPTGHVSSHWVTTGRPLTLRQVVAACERATGREIPIRWGARPYRPNQVMRVWQGQRLPGWQPRIALEDGIASLVLTRGTKREEC